MHTKERRTKSESSLIMRHRYAKRTIGWSCPSSSRCKDLRGQPQRDRGRILAHWAQCARVRRCKKEHTLAESQSWASSNDSGLGRVNWEPHSKIPRRIRKTDIFIVFYLFVFILSPFSQLVSSLLVYVTISIYFCFYYCTWRRYPLYPMLFIPDSDMLFPCWNSQSFHLHSGGSSTSYYTNHVIKRFIPHVHRARLLNGFENSSNLAENRIEYLLLTSWDENSIFSSANRVRPDSQKLPLNGFTEWNILRNKEKAYQNRE